VPAGWATFFLTGGLTGLLFHAAYDADIQFRRLYMVFGYLAVAVGAFLCLLPYEKVGDQFGPGFLLLMLGLFFLLAFLRNETETKYRDAAHWIIGGGGTAMALVGLVGGLLKRTFLVAPNGMPFGVLLAVMGLVYVAAAVGSRGTSDDRSYYLGLGTGVVGAIVFVIALLRSIFPTWPIWFEKVRTVSTTYFVPNGVLLMTLGLLYVVTSLLLVAEFRLVVLVRRELGAFFFSPLAYMVILGYAFVHWLSYYLVVAQIYFRSLGNPNLGQPGVPTPEPIVQYFILQWTSVFCVVFVVPLLTMGLLSEEKKSGTLEVLLTAPVDESGIVLSKFLAGFLMFILTWVPFGLFLLALRVLGGKPFDYLPLLSFTAGLLVVGAGFVSMGLFFSSLTRNQLTSGVLTFVGMLGLTFVYMARQWLTAGSEPPGFWQTILKNVADHITYIDLWFDTLQGKLMPRALLFPASMTILFLFLTIKVLEARKWK
jgi:ABC-type transport system involved in multi-copper enzyme maturation permease subunit